MITIQPYQEDWPHRFQEYKRELESLFAPIPHVFHPIGSTAVEGCGAKPIIDILGVTNDITQIDAFNGAIEALGYTPLGEYGLPQRRYFEKEGVHLHIFEDSDPDVGRHLRFCHYLNLHPEEVSAYTTLKNSLAEKYPEDIFSYLLGKESFVKRIDRQAALEGVQPAFYPPLGPRKRAWTSEEILKAMHVNMTLQMVYFSKYSEALERLFQPDVTVVRSRIVDDTFNYIIGAKFTEENTSKRVPEVLSLFKEKNLPFSWWVSEWADTPSNLQEILKENGLSYKEKDVGMYLELYDYVYHPPEKYVFRRVEIEASLRDFCDVLTSIEIPSEIYSELMANVPPILYKEGASFEMYLLYLNGEPVATGIAVFHANVMGIYYVTTHPEYRRSGLGTAMMEYLLGRARAKGYWIATLQASEAGKSLYERLGFTPCCNFLEYT